MNKQHAPIRVLVGTLFVIWLSPELAQAIGEGASPGVSERLWAWWDKLREQVTTPLFWFGMCAQMMFFMRFIWQWIVSERRGHSTIPIAFWYFSLLGGVAMFFYACLKVDPVIMLGQALACLIYARNLTLIYSQATRRKQAGLPQVKLRSGVNGENDAEEEK